MTFLSRFFARKPDPREELRPLWMAIVAEARRPFWYVSAGVGDTVTGRFDMVAMITALVLRRMGENSALAAPSALVTELFVEDMEGQLREFGVGDVIVGKRMGKLMSTLGGRLGALAEALPQGVDAVSEVVSRNVTLIKDTEPNIAAHEVVELAERLAQVQDDALLAGSLGAEPTL